jgi:hypothetical protein
MKEAIPQIIHRIPHGDQTPEQWGENISSQLELLWGALVSNEERCSWEKFRNSWDGVMPALTASVAQMPALAASAVRKLDEIILDDAQITGWRMVSSGLVRLRFRAWQDQEDGADLFERLGKAFAKSVRYFQRKETPPLNDPTFAITKKKTVEELRPLLSSLRTTLSVRHREPSAQEALQAFSEAVQARRLAYPRLTAALDHWMMFLQQEPFWITGLSQRTRISPAGLFDSWFAWCKGVDPVHLRQEISRHGSPSKKPLAKL